MSVNEPALDAVLMHMVTAVHSVYLRIVHEIIADRSLISIITSRRLD